LTFDLVRFTTDLEEFTRNFNLKELKNTEVIKESECNNLAFYGEKLV